MVVRNIIQASYVTRIRHAQIAAARLWIRMLLIIGFVVDFFSNLLRLASRKRLPRYNSKCYVYPA